MPDLADRARSLADAMAPLTLVERIRLARREVPGRLVFTTSFGIEDQALTHAVAEAGAGIADATGGITDAAGGIAIVTLDTGRLFPETADVWAATEDAYRLRIAAVAPEREAVERFVRREGINGFRRSIEARQLCCGLRKVEPLGRALAGAAGWLTGLRAAQSAARAATPLAEADAARGLIKINPLADWTREQIDGFVHENAVPYNVLHDRGFPSIGCAPCTRAVRIGEDERAGRWWWERESKKECGLHPGRPGRGVAPGEEPVAFAEPLPG